MQLLYSSILIGLGIGGLLLNGCLSHHTSSETEKLSVSSETEGSVEEEGSEEEILEPDNSDPEDEVEGDILLRDVMITGMFSERKDILLKDGFFVEIGSIESDSATVLDMSGRWITPAFIDSHVHFAYLPRVQEMLDGGICAAVDLAAPEDFLSADFTPMRLLQSGPMITSENGYPTQSWGANGYGIQCGDISCIEESIDQLKDRGAMVIKIPLVSPILSSSLLQAGVQRAHQHDLKVVSHALNDGAAQLAAQADVDVLAHCPTSELSDATIAMWSGKAVISTLSAFGGDQSTIENLRRLHQAGSIILYGTDFGNAQQTGISSSELALLLEAGLSGEEIIAAGTSIPAEWWGFSELGMIAEQHQASFVITSEDPLENPMVLASPIEVWINGQKR